MKKLSSFLAILLMAVCAISFSSCSSDDDGEKNNKPGAESLVGKWKITEKHDWNRTYSSEYTVHGDIFVVFSADGTMKREGDGYISDEMNLSKDDPLKRFSSWSYSPSSVNHDGYIDFNSTSQYGVDFKSATQIELWGFLMYDFYYVLQKVN